MVGSDEMEQLYKYPASMRTSLEGKRHYEIITGEKLPSDNDTFSDTVRREERIYR